MSKPKRYRWMVNAENDFDLIEHPQGEYVLYADYAALQAENDSLSKSLGIERAASIGFGVECRHDYAALKAENERLRKAGDAMASELTEEFIGRLLIKEWLAAKGVQS